MQLNLFDTSSSFHYLQDQIKRLVSMAILEGRSDNVTKLYQSANLRIKNRSSSRSEKDELRYRLAKELDDLMSKQELTSKEVYKKAISNIF